MAVPKLIPITIAIPLIIAILIAVVPLTPISWVAITVTQIARGVRQQQQLSHTLTAIGRWIGLSIVWPWAAVGVLLVMVGAQILLAPVVLLHHIRILVDDVIWAAGWLGVSTQSSAQAEHESAPSDEDDMQSAWEDITPPPPYHFSPLPRTSPATIRLLALYPGPLDSPLRGTLTTVALPSEGNPKSSRISSYIYLSYSTSSLPSGTALASPRSPSTPSSYFPRGNEELLLLHDPTTTASSAATGQRSQQWRTLPIPSSCASSLRRLRHLHYSQYEPRGQHMHFPKPAAGHSSPASAPLLTVWVADACVNRADAAERTAHSLALRERIISAAGNVVAVVDADAEERLAECGDGRGGAAALAVLLEWVKGIPEEDVRRRLRAWWCKEMGVKGVNGEDVEDETGFEPGSLLRGQLTQMAGVHRSARIYAAAVSMVPEGIRAVARKLAERCTPGLLVRAPALNKSWQRWLREARKACTTLNLEEIYLSCLLGLRHPNAVSPPPPPPPEDIPAAAREFFSQPWFRQLTSLLDAGLPDLARVHFICRGQDIAGERVLYLASLLGRQATHEEHRLGEAFRLLRRSTPPGNPSGSCLLDILLATRTWQTEDPRDAVFLSLRLSESLDRGALASARTACKIDCRAPLAKVYAALSAHLIKSHGPGLFLSLVKSPPDIKGLPSWAADWTAQWPNKRALAGMPADACRFRTADARDEVMDFELDEEGSPAVMVISRRRVVRGFFTRTGHMDGAEKVIIENVRQLGRDEVLVEMYPGLTLLLRREKGDGEMFKFLRVCPHALSREGVEKVVGGWSRVVVHREDPGRLEHDGSPPRGYLSLPGVYRIV
ncbi:hypothetical protein VTJ83DRAFT_2837 [Remersonia thermophila]|uniref:Heterokaryon incompatibility domain-containing protein n=1 Tax=Remersonia thermophila TaxID=72144 RepID=A0ABR4DCC7_9PEZI